MFVAHVVTCGGKITIRYVMPTKKMLECIEILFICENEKTGMLFGLFGQI